MRAPVANKLRSRSYKLDDQRIFSRIGINCHLCPRQACSQRAHQPVFMERRSTPPGAAHAVRKVELLGAC